MSKPLVAAAVLALAVTAVEFRLTEELYEPAAKCSLLGMVSALFSYYTNKLLNRLCKRAHCTYVLGKSRSNTALGAGLVGRSVRVHGRVLLRRLVEIQV